MPSLLRRDLDELVITAQEVRPRYASSGPLSSPPDIYSISANPVVSAATSARPFCRRNFGIFAV